MWGKTRGIAVVVCLAMCGRAPAQNQVVPAHSTGPALETDRGSDSFRGLRVSIGETSSSHKIVIRSNGDTPLTGLTASTHGDFVITANTCPQTLPPAVSKETRCSVSVAFRPTATGPRSGDLTIRAAGLQPQVVPLLAGIAIDLGTVKQGETRVQWIISPVSTTAVSGTVTGPFTIALQDAYSYGSITSISFGTTSSSAGASGFVYLGFELIATTLGPQSGTITLSNGTSYELTVNVAPATATFEPGTVEFGSFPNSYISLNIPVQSVSGPYPVTFTNTTGSTLGITGVATSPPFSETDDCGISLPMGASCVLSVVFSPTATGPASGELAVATDAGSYMLPLSAAADSNDAQVAISPAAITFSIPKQLAFLLQRRLPFRTSQPPVPWPWLLRPEPVQASIPAISAIKLPPIPARLSPPIVPVNFKSSIRKLLSTLRSSLPRLI